jgi:glycine/D-amino acid oxidase-like deaminating enzyme
LLEEEQKVVAQSQPQAEYPPSWYAATARIAESRAELTGNISCEICVIGGGLAGLTLANELARRGRSVVLLEANRIGWGASGRNGGFVSAGFAESIVGIIKRVGLAEAKALYRLSVEGLDHVRSIIAERDSTIAMGSGWIVAQRYPDADGQRRISELLNREFDQKTEVLDPAQTRCLLKSERYFHSRFDPSAFHIHPLRYCLVLAAAAEDAGARVFEATRVQRVMDDKRPFQLVTAQGRITADQVVYCTSAHDRHLAGVAGRAILPVATYVAVTEALWERAGLAIATQAAVSDTRRSGDYYRRVADGRILWGGRITTRISEPRQLAAEMKQDMLGVFPQLGDPRMEFAWSGIMSYALHKMPIIGEIAPGQWAAMAFGGHGLNTTAMAGILIARAIADKDDEWRRFTAFGTPWAGGLAGRIGVQLSYWHMQLQDRIDEYRASRPD